MPHGHVHGSVLGAVHQTPLIKLGRVIPRGGATVLCKLEYLSPTGSIKDRLALAMIESAEQRGYISRDTRIIEASTGHMGRALAFVCAFRGYRLTVTMPESASPAEQAAVRTMGGEVVLTPAADGMAGAVERARALSTESKAAWMPEQFANPVGPLVHQRTTGMEIWHATAGRVDIFIAGVGTGGTITGVAHCLRSRKTGVQTVAVEPAESPAVSGGKARSHGITGLCPGVAPRHLDTSLFNGIEQVTCDEAREWTSRLAREEGIYAGISTGANICVAARLAARPENRGRIIVTVASSAGEPTRQQ